MANNNSRSDSIINMKRNCNDNIEHDEESSKHQINERNVSKDSSRTHSNEHHSGEADDSMTDSSELHNNKLSESSGQKRLALSPPLSSSVVYPSSPERYNSSKSTSQKLPSPLDRHSFLYNRRDHPDKHYKTTNNNREDGELIESEDEKEDGEVSFEFLFSVLLNFNTIKFSITKSIFCK